MPMEEDRNQPRRSSPRTTAATSETMLKDSLLSPRFRSAAAMAGWDEEALLLASLVVEDTPVRESRHKKRSSHHFKTPPTTNSNRKRRSRRQSMELIPPVILRLDDDDDEQAAEKVPGGKKDAAQAPAPASGGGCDEEKKKIEGEGGLVEKEPSKVIPCMDRLREELSCAICLEICFEPSTTPCGHSFCLRCLKCAAAKCGKRCPKCRQLISNGRSCTVNTVLWNTIQLLFPEEVEARKNSTSATSHGIEAGSKRTEENSSSSHSNGRSNARNSLRRSATQASQVVERERSFRRSSGPSQSEDAALAFRLQREEFMVAFQDSREQQRNALNNARANLREMASRAVYSRLRSRAT